MAEHARTCQDPECRAHGELVQLRVAIGKLATAADVMWDVAGFPILSTAEMLEVADVTEERIQFLVGKSELLYSVTGAITRGMADLERAVKDEGA